MFAVYRELEGTAYLALHAVRRLGVLRLPPVMEEFMRQVYFTGASARLRQAACRRCRGTQW